MTNFRVHGHNGKVCFDVDGMPDTICMDVTVAAHFVEALAVVVVDVHSNSKVLTMDEKPNV